jgi:hypothetical protein
VDCNGGVNSVDSLKILRKVAGLSVQQNEPCKDIGVAAAPRERSESHAGGMDAMNIDMDPTGNTASVVDPPPSNGHAEVLGSVQNCARVNENNTLDADEDAEDTLTIDVTAVNVPASDKMIGFAFSFEFPSGSIEVASEEQTFLLYAQAGSSLFGGLSDSLPDSASPWVATGTDGGPNPGSSESGSGVMDRLEINTFGGSVPGVFPLTLTGNAHVNTAGVGKVPDVTNNAQVAVDQACPGGPTATATTTPTPTVTPPSGAKQGDINCDGSITAVDALFVLRYVAQMAVNLPGGCPAIGSG